MTDDRLLSPPESGLPKVPFAQVVREAEAALPTTLPANPADLFFALDIDGTLKGRGGVSPRVHGALERARNLGARVVISTGRGVDSTGPVVGELGLFDAWAVCSNGAITVQWDSSGAAPRYRVTDRRVFDAEPVAEQLLRELPAALLAVDHDRHGMRVSDLFPEGELLRQTRAENLADLLSDPVTKLVGRAPWLSRDEFAQVIESIPFEGVEVAVGWTSWVDFASEGVTKASGLQALRDRLEVDQAGTIAIGDGMNDTAMLRWAAHGVAMGGAAPEVQDSADAVTAPVEHDGAAAVIEAVLRQY